MHFWLNFNITACNTVLWLFTCMLLLENATTCNQSEFLNIRACADITMDYTSLDTPGHLHAHIGLSFNKRFLVFVLIQYQAIIRQHCARWHAEIAR